MDVVISLSQHYVPTIYSGAREPPIAWVHLNVRYKASGRVLCECTPTPGEVMTASQLNSCVTTILARQIPVPRICIRLCWIPNGPGDFVVEVVLHLVTGWLPEDMELYVEECDPWSEFWDRHGPIHQSGMLPCVVCGDSTREVPGYNGRGSALCVRCEPNVVCHHCRCVIQGRPMCMQCVRQPEELIFLSEEQLRWIGAFAQYDIPSD